jgi:hypothetical protein
MFAEFLKSSEYLEADKLIQNTLMCCKVRDVNEQ